MHPEMEKMASSSSGGFFPSTTAIRNGGGGGGSNSNGGGSGSVSGATSFNRTVPLPSSSSTPQPCLSHSGNKHLYKLDSIQLFSSFFFFFFCVCLLLFQKALWMPLLLTFRTSTCEGLLMVVAVMAVAALPAYPLVSPVVFHFTSNAPSSPTCLTHPWAHLPMPVAAYRSNRAVTSVLKRLASTFNSISTSSRSPLAK